jgi:endo-1,4-beta-xylanase
VGLSLDRAVSRRSFLVGAGAVSAGLAACSKTAGVKSSAPTPRSSTTAGDCPASEGAGGPHSPLWETADRQGILYGSTTATWQISDAAYSRLYGREAAILSTEDDFLWYRVRPSPTSGLKFKYSDQIVAFAKKRGMLMFGAHLVWDQGFGNGWNDNQIYGMDTATATKMLWGTVDALVKRYRGQIAIWSVANEVLDGSGLRKNVPWYGPLGSSYVSDAFNRVHDADPAATLLLNDYGYETDVGSTLATDKQAATLAFLDQLLSDNVPVHGLGIQAHLNAGDFATGFDPTSYRRFLSEVADKGLKILITEMDVLDDGLPPDIKVRDRAVADTYRRYLDAALQEPAVASLITFGLSDRYTWLQEDYPRNDGATRRPLPFDDKLKPKPAYQALSTGLKQAPQRAPVWQPPRCEAKSA